MLLLADENIPRSVVAWLRANGHDVSWASEIAMGAPDASWLAIAEAEQRVIITSDKDFGDLIFRDALTSVGIILLRLDDVPIPQWLARLQQVWSVIEANPGGCFIVVTATRVRVRPLA